MTKCKEMIFTDDAVNDFAKVAEIADKQGMAVVCDNDAPKYLILNIEDTKGRELLDALTLSEQLIDQNMEAYKELAR